MSPRFESLRKALLRFREALDQVKNPLDRDGAIQRFEFCFELSWKCIRDAAGADGLSADSPKACFRVAFQQGWVDDEMGWLRVLEDRNISSHTYNEDLAVEIFDRLPSHLKLMEVLARSLEKAGKE